MEQSNLIQHWESHLESARKAVEVAEKALERLYNENQLVLDIGSVAVNGVNQ